MSDKLLRRAAVLLTLLGAGLVILAGSRTWATVNVGVDLPTLADLTVSGRRAVPAGVPIALAAAAGAIVLATSGRMVRVLVALGLVIAGAGLAVSSVRATADTSGAVAKALRDSLKVVGSPSDANSVNGGLGAGSVADISIWPWVAGLGAGLIAGAGLLVLLQGWSWPGPTRRFERSADAVGAPGAAQSGPGSARPVDLGPADTWDALSRGEDPTSKLEEPT